VFKSQADITFDAAVYIMYTDRLFKEFQIGFQETDISDSVQ